MSKFTTLALKTRNGLRIITLNNPTRKNAFNDISYNELPQALEEAGKDDSVKIVALTGSGDFYSSGNDIKSKFDMDGDLEEKIKNIKNTVVKFVRSFYTFPKPLVAVINGPCIGIAATTAALCDVIYASETAYFTTPFTSLGLSPEGCSSYTFPKILGKSKAMEMLILNHKMSAEEALKFNFVSEIFKLNEIEKIWERLEKFSENPINSMLVCKKLIKYNELNILERTNIEECDELEKRLLSEDAIEAMMKFLSKKSKKSKL